MKTSLKKLFQAAKYSDILDLSTDSYNSSAKYKLGALVFLGRNTEARHLLSHFNWSNQDRVECYFYILLSSLRRSDYKPMLEDLSSLYKAAKNNRSHQTDFFLHQALGLIRYYKGEFNKAYSHSLHAFQLALKTKENYFCMISNDLMAHSCCMLENYSRGIQLFDDSLVFAKKIENNSNVHIIELSKMSYKIEAGWDLPNQEKALGKWIATINPQDYLSKTNAFILKSKLLQLKGQFKQAEDLLIDISKQVYSHDQGRQILSYNLSLAQLRLIIDGPEKTLSLINTSMKLCDQGQDSYFSHRFKELESYASSNSDKSKNKSILFEFEKITGRKSKFQYPLAIISEESLNNLLNKNQNHPFNLNILKKLRELGLLGLIFSTKAYEYQDFIDFRLAQRVVLLSIQGNLELIEDLSSRQYELLFLLTSKSHWSRKDLFESFWQVPYDPFIHNNKLYVTLKRLKNKFSTNVEFFSFEKGTINVRHIKIFQKHLIKEIAHSNNIFSRSNLNPRQLKIINAHEDGSFIFPRDQIQIYGVSRNTISRDLNDMVEKGLIYQFGKGRGTYYCVRVEN